MGETVSPGPFRLARFLALVLVAGVNVRAQLNSCGQHQCHTFAMGGDQYPCWDAPDLDAWGPKFVREWTNCSAAWGSDFRGVNRSRWWDGASKTVSDWDYCTLNYFAYRFVCLEADGKTEKAVTEPIRTTR